MKESANSFTAEESPDDLVLWESIEVWDGTVRNRLRGNISDGRGLLSAWGTDDGSAKDARDEYASESSPADRPQDSCMAAAAASRSAALIKSNLRSVLVVSNKCFSDAEEKVLEVDSIGEKLAMVVAVAAIS